MGSLSSRPPTPTLSPMVWLRRAHRVQFANSSHWYVAKRLCSSDRWPSSFAPFPPSLLILTLFFPQSHMEEIKLKGSLLANPQTAWETRASALLAIGALVTSEEFRAVRQDELRYPQLLEQLQVQIFSRVSSQVCVAGMVSLKPSWRRFFFPSLFVLLLEGTSFLSVRRDLSLRAHDFLLAIPFLFVRW